MGNITETPVWEPDVFQIEVTTPLLGGPPEINGSAVPTAGHLNVAQQQLANRTAYLKETLENTDIDVSCLDGRVDIVETTLNLKANIASPALTGIPTAPTASKGTNTTQIATTAFVTGASGLPLSGGTLTGQVIGTQARMGAFIARCLINANTAGAMGLTCGTHSVFYLTLTGATSLFIPTMAAFTANSEVLTIVVRITQGATAQTLNWFTGIKWLTAGGTVPATPTANQTVESIFTLTDGERASAWVGRVGASN